MIIDRKVGWQQFLQLCQHCEHEVELEALLDLLLTIEEKQQLAMRVLLIKELLIKSKTQRQIAQDLELSIAKITRGSNALKTISPELRHFLINKLQQSTIQEE